MQPANQLKPARELNKHSFYVLYGCIPHITVKASIEATSTATANGSMRVKGTPYENGDSIEQSHSKGGKWLQFLFV